MTNPQIPTPHVVTPAALVQPARGSAAASAVAVYLGGYIVVLALSNSLSASLAGYGAGLDVIALLLGQLLFAVVVVIVGFCLAPAPTARKLVASVIVVVGVMATVATQTARLTTGFGGIPVGSTLANQFFMVTLAVGAGWLIVRFARLGWLALLLTVVLVPLPYAFSYMALTSGISQSVLFVLTGIVGAVILLAGRPGRQVVATTAG
jgi:hypothetical protein